MEIYGVIAYAWLWFMEKKKSAKSKDHSPREAMDHWASRKAKSKNLLSLDVIFAITKFSKDKTSCYE